MPIRVMTGPNRPRGAVCEFARKLLCWMRVGIGDLDAIQLPFTPLWSTRMQERLGPGHRAYWNLFH